MVELIAIAFMLGGIGFILIFAFLVIDGAQHHVLYRIKEKHDKLKKRLLYDGSVQIESTMRMIKHWETEFNIEKPDYCFWIRLRK
jgi:hypothetical protein